jgi:hypothetical protein
MSHPASLLENEAVSVHCGTFQLRIRLILRRRIGDFAMKGKVVFIDEATLTEMLSFVSGCSQCALTPELTLDYILDALTRNGPTTVYLLPRIPTCPHCGHEIDRATFINVA